MSEYYLTNKLLFTFCKGNNFHILRIHSHFIFLILKEMKIYFLTIFNLTQFFERYLLSHDALVLSHDTPALSHDTPALSHDTLVLSHDTLVLSHDTLALSHDTFVLSNEQRSSSNEQR